MNTALKKHREATGLTLTKLSEETGIGVSHLSRLERGQAGVSLVNALLLAKATGLPVEAFAPR